MSSINSKEQLRILKEKRRKIISKEKKLKNKKDALKIKLQKNEGIAKFITHVKLCVLENIDLGLMLKDVTLTEKIEKVKIK